MPRTGKTKKGTVGLALLSMGLITMLSGSARADLYTWSGQSPVGHDVSFEAELTIVSGSLTVVLRNTSLAASTDPTDLLGSFYFDIVHEGSRPTLTYLNATGPAYDTVKNGPDVRRPDIDDIDVALGKPSGQDQVGGWQFKVMDASQSPFLGFGIGTVGNSSLSNSFNGDIVGTGRIDYAIYVGDVTTNNLKDTTLVKNTATFTFSGLSGYSEADITGVVFGMGTDAEKLVYVPPQQVPLPGAMILGSLGLGAAGYGLKRKKKTA